MDGRGRSCNMSSRNSPSPAAAGDVSARGAVVGVDMAEQGAACMRADWRRGGEDLSFFDLDFVAGQAGRAGRAGQVNRVGRLGQVRWRHYEVVCEAVGLAGSRNIERKIFERLLHRTGSLCREPRPRHRPSLRIEATIRAPRRLPSRPVRRRRVPRLRVRRARVGRPRVLRPRIRTLFRRRGRRSSGLRQASAAKQPRPPRPEGAHWRRHSRFRAWLSGIHPAPRRRAPRRTPSRSGSGDRARQPWPGRTRRGVRRGERRRTFPRRCRSATRCRQDVVPSATRRRSRPAKTRRPACSRCRR